MKLKKFNFLLILMSAILILPQSVPTVRAVPAPPGSVELPVIMYHFLTVNRGEHHISPAEFEKDLAYLQQNGYTAVGASELIDYVYNGIPLPPKPVMLTFDDGYYNNYEKGFPLLKKYNTKIVISLIGDHTDIWSGNFYKDLESGHMTWEQVSEMYNSGLAEFGNHTYALHHFTEYGANPRKGCTRNKGEPLFEYQKLFRNDVQRLQHRALEECGFTPTVFAFPFMETCEEAVEVLKALDFKVAFTKSGKSNTVTYGNPDCLLDLRRTNRTYLRSAQMILEG